MIEAIVVVTLMLALPLGVYALHRVSSSRTSAKAPNPLGDEGLDWQERFEAWQREHAAPPRPVRIDNAIGVVQYRGPGPSAADMANVPTGASSYAGASAFRPDVEVVTPDGRFVIRIGAGGGGGGGGA